MPRLLRDLTGKRVFADGCVACVGAFDGLHLGHQALIGRAVERGRALGLPVLTLAFEPLPREYFATLRGTPPPARLSTPRDRIQRLWSLGVETVALPRFDARLARLPAEAFITDVLLARFGVREVWVGPGFRFGRDRGGDLALLKSAGDAHDFRAEAIAPLPIQGERVSSTRVRAALAAGDFDLAARLLGRRYRIGGRVVHGQQLGRQLGYPTANLRFPWSPPLAGIFAVRVHGIGSVARDGVASFGTRPTVGGTDCLLEAHVFDFDGDLYGQRIEVEFVRHLRDEQRFDGLPALVAQMHRDAAAAREVLAATLPPTTPSFLRQAHSP